MLDPSLLVLSSLADGDKHGYAIMVDIDGFAGAHLGPGTLYGAITRLEERGWIRPLDAKERRRPYRITAQGRKHLKEQLSVLERAVEIGLDRLRRV
jgi:DNA-binding PadR family transcriptional regulator